MIWSEFRTQVPGKWVLTGEHAVLRGATAVALPHHEINLALSFQPLPEPNELRVEPAAASAFIGDLINSIADEWESQGNSFPKPKGLLQIKSSIPIGAGLGSSAALCVALTRWMGEPLGIPQDHQIEFATRLEHRFHGRSSGMDVAVIAANDTISFSMQRGMRSLGIKKLPRFTFHDTGLRSRTSECVLKVESFRESNPIQANQVDELMASASRLAMEGLIQYDSNRTLDGLKLVQQAMAHARECFYRWDLVPGEAKLIEEALLKQGALAAKLTGAGGGGMIVALWPDT